jgi:hypothetical protein
MVSLRFKGLGVETVGATVSQLNVSTNAELEQAIQSYIAQGFVVSNRTNDSVTLFKKKEFNVVWAIVGFFLCLIPLLVYSIVYASKSDEMIVIRVGALSAVGAAGELGLVWSEDGHWWSDGTKWRDASREVPPGATLSDDQRFWWDGTAWRPLASDGGTPIAAAPAPEPTPADGDAGAGDS